MIPSNPIQALRNADKLIRKAQDILARYVEPGQLSAEDAMAELLGLLDGPEQRAVQEAIAEVLQRTP